MSAPAVPTPKFRKDYRPSEFLIDHVSLLVDLYETHAEIRADLQVRPNPAAAHCDTLVLDGEDLDLRWLAIDGNELSADAWQQSASDLRLKVPDGAFTLSTLVHLRPQDNTRLEGLYQSNGKFCTQCEAEGFRRITFFLDRPDVLATYDLTLRADAARYPHLLGNGNPAGSGALDAGRHFARWLDPFPKPCYLFALVAGDFDVLSDQIFTRSGKKVALKIYVDKGKLTQCHHAMASLKRAMRWDEQVYGLEYDLDVYQIVAVSDFNMGAMENKGLNIFNTKYVLAHPETATDADYEGVESVIAHEYFHNWTGNRVTCRDWFQLSLKEGLTVFRDQCFSQDMGSATVKRIDDVRVIRTAQFSEDAGPMAHPIRPDSYVEMNNFYTVTVYNKGAEVIRMLHGLLGAEGFRRGMDLYFERHDGQAVTCDDFVAAHADANDADLQLFSRWYSQAGTPVLTVTDRYDAAKKEYRLTVKQTCPATPGQAEKQPFLIPLRVGLVDARGAVPARVAHPDGTVLADGAVTDVVLPLSSGEQTFVFTEVERTPVPSLLRDFSAPVRLHYDWQPAQLAVLLAADPNLFNRWDAAQTLASNEMLRLAAGWRRDGDMQVSPEVLAAFAAVIADAELEPGAKSRLLTLPDLNWLQEQVEVIDLDALLAGREVFRSALARTHRAALAAAWHAVCAPASTETEAENETVSDAARRALAASLLELWVASTDPQALNAAVAHYHSATNMTDRFAALRILVHAGASAAAEVLADFAARYKDEALVMDKWFAVQAQSPQSDALAKVRALAAHPAFDARNPNKIRALFGGFAHGNPAAFHAADGSGYRYIAEQVGGLNASNPQIAARLVSSFNRWRRYDAGRQQGMLAALQGLMASGALSNDVHEVVSKAVEQA